MDTVTLFITACNRPDLLKITLESFLKFNTYPIYEAIIMEDSGKEGINDFVKDILPFPCTIYYNNPKRGQMKSIEYGSQFIKTPYVFHCEEDWEFYNSGFIEKSFEILQQDTTITSVLLLPFSYFSINNNKFSIPIMKPQKKEYWICGTWDYFGRFFGHFSFNPGLRTLEVHKAHMPFPENFGEKDLSAEFHKKGMKCAVINFPEGYVRHIGWNRHVE